MKIFVNHNIVITCCIVSRFVYLVSSSLGFNYEKMHNYGLGNRVLHNLRRFNYYEHPEPLPTTTPSLHFLHSPFQSIYQGARKVNDTRVFRRSFQYSAKTSGHHILVDGTFSCIITHMAIETSGGIPILLRGGVGYHYFVVVARAKPGKELKGSVRAYCLRVRDDYHNKLTS